ncbi:MAG: NYN domain-containing protein [Deltaproteobacteria bacterium]|nr:NYN domain-containing protein [Deltaproteobacteria bacterium]
MLVFADEVAMSRNVARNFNRGMDWAAIRDYLVDYGSSWRELVEMALYVSLFPDRLPGDEGLETGGGPTVGSDPEGLGRRRLTQLRRVSLLEKQGFLVHALDMRWVPSSIKGDSFRYVADIDIAMAADIIDVCFQIRPDIVTLMTSEPGYAHVARVLRRRGIRVEVASTPQVLPDALRRSVNGFIDLSDLFESFEAL